VKRKAKPVKKAAPRRSSVTAKLAKKAAPKKAVKKVVKKKGRK